MTELKETNAGREGKKGDLSVYMQVKPAEGLSLDIESSVGHMFGEQIRETVEKTCSTLGVNNCYLKVSDMGALDYVIQARVEGAARRLFEVTEPGCVPQRKVTYEAPRRDRLRRTRLYLPGNNPDLMRNAGLFGADCVILDLEDSVSPGEKDTARILVRNTLLMVDFGKAERIVRINPISTGYGARDLEMVLPAGPDTILIPKCEAEGDVREVEKIVSRIEKKTPGLAPVLLMPLIETARGILNAYQIGKGSKRVVALCFGAEDFTADIGVQRTKEGKESFTARSMLVLGAKAAGVQAIDTVFSDVQDTEGLIQSTQEAMALGFEGKGVIHPSQIEPIHQVFSPTPESIEYARKVVAVIDEARRKGSGVAA
ncbi:MAG: HpcH/HpaI aldolase/citrate lyase family protein, partial [Candidatus Krumholzibacteriota bacterium]|nr:HpcH/HpaI aldolase/citrate lyase family protein [Candidatus Krumholzibacteriota bacterium]